MKQATTEKIFHIVTEPGDATRYDFYLVKIENVICCFDPKKYMKYPEMIYTQDLYVETSTTRDFCHALIRLAKDMGVNVNTLNQVLLAIKECYPELQEN